MTQAMPLIKESIQHKVIGSLDHADAIIQMRAIDLAMRQYFGSENWLKTRHEGLHAPMVPAVTT